jgi:outer membrane protein insertion porin family
MPTSLWGQTLDKKRFVSYENQPVTKITITGNNVTKEYVIRRELKVEVGEPFTLEGLTQTVRNLDNLGVFSSIKVTTSDHDNGVALDFEVREMPWIIPYIKLKYNEENGWSIGPTVSSLNFLGRGIKLSAFWLFGGTSHSHN